MTKPDNTTDVFTATTDAQGAFTTEKDYLAGEYSAVFHVDKDAKYQAADTGSIPFTVNLEPRTITAKVVVS